MGTRSLTRIIAIAILAAVPAATVAQTQTQQGQSQNQNQGQQSQGQQPAQPAQKLSVWQKIKNQANAAKQTGQNTVQQGQNTVKQGQDTVQQGTQQVQQGVQGAQQGAQGVQQQIVPGGSQANGGGASSCGSSCFDAGPFQANVSQMTMSQQGPWHIIRMNVQFHNATNQPLIIAYHDGSMVMVDNNGNTYQGAGGNPGQLQGMGIDRGNQTDSQFVLDPGQTGNAMFSVARARGNDSPVGTGYTYNLTIDELQAQNGAMAIPVRTYNLNFPSLAPSSVASSTATFPSGSSPAKGFVAGGAGAGTVGTAAAPQGNTQGAPGQRRVAVPAQQPATPAAAVNKAAMKTTTTTTATKPAAAIKPVAATATTTKKAAPPKKTTDTTTTTTTGK